MAVLPTAIPFKASWAICALSVPRSHFWERGSSLRAAALCFPGTPIHWSHLESNPAGRENAPGRPFPLYPPHRGAHPGPRARRHRHARFRRLVPPRDRPRDRPERHTACQPVLHLARPGHRRAAVAPRPVAVGLVHGRRLHRRGRLPMRPGGASVLAAGAPHGRRRRRQALGERAGVLPCRAGGLHLHVHICAPDALDRASVHRDGKDHAQISQGRRPPGAAMASGRGRGRRQPPGGAMAAARRVRRGLRPAVPA